MHVLSGLRSHPFYANDERKQISLRCRVCHARCSSYCVQCSDALGEIVVICNPTVGRPCFANHQDANIRRRRNHNA